MSVSLQRRSFGVRTSVKSAQVCPIAYLSNHAYVSIYRSCAYIVVLFKICQFHIDTVERF